MFFSGGSSCPDLEECKTDGILTNIEECTGVTPPADFGLGRETVTFEEEVPWDVGCDCNS